MKYVSQEVCDEVVMLATKRKSTNDHALSRDDISPSEQTQLNQKDSLALNEFCQSMNLTNNYDRIAAIAVYLKQNSQLNLFRKDVKDLFARAGFPPPAGVDRDLRETVKKGWISKLPNSDDEFFPTGKGIKYITEKTSK